MYYHSYLFREIRAVLSPLALRRRWLKNDGRHLLWRVRHLFLMSSLSAWSNPTAIPSQCGLPRSFGLTLQRPSTGHPESEVYHAVIYANARIGVASYASLAETSGASSSFNSQCHNMTDSNRYHRGRHAGSSKAHSS